MAEVIYGEQDDEYPALLEVQTHEILEWDQDTTIDKIQAYQSERSHRPRQRPQGNRSTDNRSNGFQQRSQGNCNQENRKPKVFMDGETWSELTPDGKKGWLTVPEDDKKKILMKGKVRKPSNPQENSSRLNAQAHEVECNDDEDLTDPSSLHAGRHEQRQAPNKATVPQDSTADTNVQSVTPQCHSIHALMHSATNATTEASPGDIAQVLSQQSRANQTVKKHETMLPRSDLSIYIVDMHEQHQDDIQDPREEPDPRLDQSQWHQPCEDHPGLFADDLRTNMLHRYKDDCNDEYRFHDDESLEELSIHTIDPDDPLWSNNHDVCIDHLKGYISEDDSSVLPPSHYTPPLRGSTTASPPTGHTAPSPTAVTTPEETSPIVYEVNMHNVNGTPAKGPLQIPRVRTYAFSNNIDQTHTANNRPSDAPSNQMIIPQAPTLSLAQSPLTTSLIVDRAQSTQPRCQPRVRTYTALADDVVITDHDTTNTDIPADSPPDDSIPDVPIPFLKSDSYIGTQKGFSYQTSIYARDTMLITLYLR